MKYEEFAKRLNMAMDNNGLSAAELARKTGISEDSISRYQKGQYYPYKKNLNLLLCALNVTEEWLLEGTKKLPKKKNENIIPFIERRKEVYLLLNSDGTQYCTKNKDYKIFITLDGLIEKLKNNNDYKIAIYQVDKIINIMDLNEDCLPDNELKRTRSDKNIYFILNEDDTLYFKDRKPVIYKYLKALYIRKEKYQDKKIAVYKLDRIVQFEELFEKNTKS